MTSISAAKKKSYSYLLFLVTLYLFLFKPFLEDYVSFIKYTDELLALVAIPIAVLRFLRSKQKRLTVQSYSIAASVFILLTAAGSLVYRYQPLGITLSDLFLCIKFWMVLYVGKHIFRDLSLQKYGDRIFTHIKVITWVLTLLIIADQIFQIFPESLRFGLRSSQLMFGHPSIFATVCALLVVIAMALKTEKRNTTVYIVWLLLLMITSLRAKAIATAFLLLIVYYLVYQRKLKFSIKSLLIAVVVLFLISFYQIWYYFVSTQDDSARYQLLVNSISVANDHFPFGAGFATFASYFSGVSYSPLYEIYGISNVEGLLESNPAYISDCFWPMVLGQGGWFSLIAFLAAIVLLFHAIQKLQSLNRAYYVSAISIWLYIAVDSISSSAYLHPTIIPLALWLGFMLSKAQADGSHHITQKLNGTVIVTYRCNARCNMCNRYKEPSKPEEELTPEMLEKLPPMYFTNITGGEPFIREDLPELVRILDQKSDRIVISTNGFFTDRIIALCKEFPNIGIRISIEGLEKTNDSIRGLPDGFKRGYGTLQKLRAMGMKDVGFGMTVQDLNAKDLVALYHLSDEMGMEFATATLHNSFYFVESHNIIHDRPKVAKAFEDLINELLASNSPKKWFRAYFNHGLINYIYQQPRLLQCNMAFDTFFLDPFGDVMPCNGTREKEVMGNISEAESFEALWRSPQADSVRKTVRKCNRQCWMIGSASPAMRKYIWVPMLWIVRHKFIRWFRKQKYSMYESKIVRDYRDGLVSKETLDRRSTCEFLTTSPGTSANDEV